MSRAEIVTAYLKDNNGNASPFGEEIVIIFNEYCHDEIEEVIIAHPLDYGGEIGLEIISKEEFVKRYAHWHKPETLNQMLDRVKGKVNERTCGIPKK